MYGTASLYAYYGVDQRKKGKPGRAYGNHEIRIAYKILVGKPDGKKSFAYRWTDNIKIFICEVTRVGVVWIYLTHAAQLQAVLKTTTTDGCLLQNQLLTFQGGGGGGGGGGCCSISVVRNSLLVFLGAFAKLQKRLLASSCLSVRMEQPGFHWTDFYEI